MSRGKHLKHGQKFGKLKILYECESRSPFGAIRYYCQCLCGNICIANGTDLRSGKHKSCGCLRHLPTHYLNPGESGFNSLYYNYQCRAKIKNIEFNLSKKEFRKITQQKCFYCGVQPNQTKFARGFNLHGAFTYNGIDRVDNQLGYNKSNCVACCGDCNRMKGTLSQKDFIHKCKQIGESYHDSLF